MNYDKPFKTYKEQIEYLKSQHGLKISNDIFAEKALKSISYYDLINGYKDIFMNGDIFLPYVDIEYLCAFHHFNTAIQSILFKYSVYIENLYKNNLAYVLSENFGVHQNEYLNHRKYANSRNSNSRNFRDNTIQKIKSVITSPYLEQPSKHYLDTHDHIPPWILFKNIKFGDSIDLYKCLKSSEKNKLNELIIPYEDLNIDKKAALLQSLTIIRKFRNVIAHNLKFVTYHSRKCLQSENLPLIIKDTMLTNINDTELNNGYAMILSIIFLLSKSFFIKDFHLDLYKLLSNHLPGQYRLVKKYFETLGIPDDFFPRFENLIDKLEDIEINN